MSNQRNSKQYQNNQKPRPKMTTTSYEKAFETFEGMIEELETLHPEFKEIFNGEEVSITNAINEVLIYFNDHIPDPQQKTNIPMNVSISANRLSLKTNKFFSFEWNFKYDKEGNISDIVATVTTFNRERNFEELDAMIEILKETWNVKEKEHKNNK